MNHKHYRRMLSDSFYELPLEKGAMGDWEKEGYKITHRGDVKDPYMPLEIIATSPDGETAGKVAINKTIKPSKGGAQLILNAIPFIHENHRRKGLASAMYRYAENISGGILKPDELTTLSAKKMWANPNRPFGGKYKYFQDLISKTEELNKAKKEEQRKIFGSYGSKKGKEKYIEIVENFARNKLNIEPVRVTPVNELEAKYGKPIEEIPDSIKAENYWKKAGSTGKYIFKPSFFEKDGKWHVAHLGTEKSLIHELAHIIRANKSIPELDAAMQRGFGAIKVSGLKAAKEAKIKGATEEDLIEARKKSNQFAYPGEYETMGLEQMISRHLGLPANTTYSYIENKKNPPKNVQVSMKTGEPIHRKIPAKSGQTKHFTHLSENVPQELKDKFNRFISGQIVYNPNKGWEESKSIDSKINRRQEKLQQQSNKSFGKSEELDKLTKGFEELFGFLAKAKANIIYIATDGDNIGASVERAALSNDIKEIKKQDKIIKRGNQTIRKWVKKRHGSIYIDGGDDISFTIHKKYLNEIEDLRNKYHEATGYTITIGVGGSISEAAHAMIYGKLKGKNQVNKWTSEIESIISQHDKKPETAEEKYQKEGLLAQKPIK